MKRPPLLFLLIAVSACLAYTSTSARIVEELIPPLDDAYIHFQYARRIAEGHPFSFQASDGYSSGATSLLWPFLLAFGWLVGFRGESIYIWSLVLGTVSLALAAHYTFRWVGRVAGERTAWFASALLLTSGPFLWASFSGMEVPLFAAAVAAVMDGLTRSDRAPGEPAPGMLSWAAVLAAVRPEGALLAGLLAIAQGVEGFLQHRRPKAVTLLWFVPVGIGAIQPLMNVVYTGMVASASALAKQNPRFLHANDIAFSSFFWDTAVWDAYGDQTLGGWAVPGMVLFAIGVWWLVLRDVTARRAGPGLLGLAWWITPMILLSALLPNSWQHFRYLLPGLVLFLPVLAIGAAQVDTGLSRYRGRHDVPFVLGTLLGCVAFSGLSWPNELGRNARDIRSHQVDVARWVAANVPANARVGTNDVGAITYLGGHRVIDLEGIVSLDLLDDALEGEGSAYAKMVELKPEILVVFPTWFRSAFAAGAIEIRRHARVVDRSITGGDDLTVSTLVPSVIATADRRPDLGEDQRVLTLLDVSNVDAERAHQVEYEDVQPELGRSNRVISGRYEGESTPVVDNARRLQGGMSLRISLEGVTWLVGRFGSSEGRCRLRVWVDGRDVGVWSVPAIAEGSWSDLGFELPDGTGMATSVVELVPMEVARPPLGGWHLARLWTVGPE